MHAAPIGARALRESLVDHPLSGGVEQGITGWRIYNT
jgi:hypothetical protein